jgi:hypothetical protein
MTNYNAPAKDDGAPAKDNGAPAKDNGAPAKDDGAPAKDNGAPAKDNGAPAKDDGAPSECCGSSGKCECHKIVKCHHCGATLDLEFWEMAFMYLLKCPLNPKTFVCNGKVALCPPCSSHLMEKECCNHQKDAFFKGDDIKLCDKCFTGTMVIYCMNLTA